MYYHYEECGTPCGYTVLNVCGVDTEVHYFHVHETASVGLRLPPVLLRGGREHLPGRDDGRDVARRAVVRPGSRRCTRPCGGFPYDDESLCYIANDWHVALLPVYLRAFYQEHMKLGFTRSVVVPPAPGPVRAG